MPRSTEGPISLGRSGFLEAESRPKDTGGRKPYTLRYSVKEILCIIVFATTIAYCGVHLFLSGIRWLQGVLTGIKN